MPNWVSYFDKDNAFAYTVSCDVAALDECDQALYGQCAVCRLDANELRPNGFPSCEDFDDIYALEDEIEQVANRGMFRYVGRRTESRGVYVLVIYGPKAESLRDALEPIFGRLGRNYRLEVHEDQIWHFYHELLYPNEAQWQCIKDDQVLDALRQHGDDLQKPRQVDHWFYLPSSAARAGLIDALERDGFRIVDTSDGHAGQHPFGVQVSRVDSVEPTSIKELTLLLFELARRYDGDYDGWETSVEKSV